MTQTVPGKLTTDTPRVTAGYRADVEGLRAVAVLLVMLMNAGLPWVHGGYVGVDVFLVISGFLITQLLVRELRSTGRLRMRRFYARRARRLLPASATVLVASALLTWAFLPPNRWVSTGWDIIGSALYTMNWRLADQSVDYMFDNSAPSMVQHYWSLSVEEQFYFLWPALLISGALIARFLRRRRLNGSLLCALAIVGVPSLAWSIYYSQSSPAKAYFVTTTRLWELALGAALAIVAVSGRSMPRVLAYFVGWAGLAAIIAAGVLFSPSTVFPGYAALLPTVGTAAVIFAGFTAQGRETGSAGWLLAMGPMETIGRHSYSLYLCHWPLVVVATAVLGKLDPITGLVVVAASAVPAYLLHHHVENPVRFSQGQLSHSIPMLKFGAAVTVVSVTAGLALNLANWPPAPPFVPPVIAKVDIGGTAAGGGAKGNADPNAIAGAGVLGAKPRGDENGAPNDTSVSIVPAPEVAANDFKNCTQTEEGTDLMSCTYGKEDSPMVVAVVGDSHADQWVPALSDIADKRGWKVVEYTKAACSFADAPITTKDGLPYPQCQQWSTALLNKLLTDKPTLVITSHIYKRVLIDGQVNFDDANRAALAAGLKRNYEALNNAGVPVLIIQDTPRPIVDIPECVQQHADKLTQCAADRSDMLPADLGAEQEEAKTGLQNVQMIDLNDAICPTDRCAAVIGNVLVYRDASHITGTYIRTLVPRLEAELSTVLK